MKSIFPKDPHNLSRDDMIKYNTIKRPHNTPEHKMSAHDWSDDSIELHFCPTCTTDFFGCKSRLDCYKCAMKDTTKVKEIVTKVKRETL